MNFAHYSSEYEIKELHMILYGIMTCKER